MAKVVIKKFDVMSVAKIYAVIGVIIGFIAGILVAIATAFVGGLMSMGGLPASGFTAGAGILSIIIFPIIYGILGFIGGAIGAFIYNVVAGKIGGIAFES